MALFSETEEKKCYKCGLLKSLSNFYANKSKPGGLQNLCKICRYKGQLEWKSKNKEYISAYLKEYRKTYVKKKISKRLVTGLISNLYGLKRI